MHSERNAQGSKPKVFAGACELGNFGHRVVGWCHQQALAVRAYGTEEFYENQTELPFKIFLV